MLPGASAANASNVTIVNTPLPVTVPSLATGALPYRVQELSPTGEAKHFAIAAAAVTGNVTPGAANQVLRRVKVTVSNDAALAVAAENTLTLTANGATIWVGSFYVGLAAGATPGLTVLADLVFDVEAFNMAAGNLTATLGAALTVGNVDVNAYFTPA